MVNQSTEEWLALEAHLRMLRSGVPEIPGGTVSSTVWQAEVESALSALPLFEPLLRLLKGSSPANYRDLLDAALRIMAAQPLGMFRDDLRQVVAQQVADGVEDALAKSKLYRFGKWLLPSAIAAVCGGTLILGYKTDGFYEALDKGKKEIAENVAKVQGERDAALKEIDKRIEDEVTSRTAKLEQLFNSADSTVTLKLKELGPRLEALTKDFGSKSDGLFDEHKRNAEAAWKHDDDNWQAILKAKHETALAYAQEKRAQTDSYVTAFRTNLDTVLAEAKATAPALAKQVEEAKAAAAELATQVADRRSEIASLRTEATANQHTIDAMAAELARVSHDGNFPAFMRFLGLRGWLAITAIVVSIAALGVALRR